VNGKRSSHPAQPDLGPALRLHQAGKVLEARGHYEKLRAAFPRHPDVLHLLGVTYLQTGENAAAIPFIEAALAVRPGDAEARCHLGNALQRLGRHAEAATAYRQAPGHAAALSNLSISLNALGRNEEALEACREALRLKPDHAEACNNLAATLKELERYEEAVAACQRALELRPDYAEALNNLGAALKELDRPEEAAAVCQRALALRPDYAEAHNNLGAAFKELRRTEEAAAAYRRALALRPGFSGAEWNLALANLCLGNFREGWPAYERRWERKEMRVQVDKSLPLWLGSPELAGQGKTLLLQFEQGFGDAIQMMRYVPLLEARGIGCCIEVPTALRDLVQRSFPRSRVVPLGEIPAGIDYRVPVMSLPLALGTFAEEAIPKAAPYLVADPERVAAWRVRLGGEGRRWFGLAWRGNPNHIHDRHRSAALDDFLPLLERREIRWVIFQKDLTAAERERLRNYGNAIVLDHELTNFETAAAMRLLDGMITVDSAPAHLAGALGLPTTIVLPFHSEWRWMLERSDSPWYPTARLFRQARAGDWAELIRRVNTALQTP